MSCELCTEGVETHPDDYVRVVIEDRNYARPMYVCPKCLHKIQRCYLCRWYIEKREKCYESPFAVSKKPKDWCGRWKQAEPILVKENDKEEVEDGCPKFELV